MNDPSTGESPAADAKHAAGRASESGWVRRWLPRLILAAVLLCGVFAPFLAGDVPLVARVQGELRFPAFAQWSGSRAIGPEDSQTGIVTWKEWWANLSLDGNDWAWMPPWPYGPQETHPRTARASPSLQSPMGRDDTGRDVLARLVHGSASALIVGGGTVLIGGLIGLLLGMWAGMRGGWVDVLVSRILEVFLCFPTLFAVLLVAAFFGESPVVLAVTLGLLAWPSFARIVRGELLSLRERDFVAAARGLGVSAPRLWLRHVLPQVWGPFAVAAAVVAAEAIVAETTVSFLGLGPGLQSASWGSVLAQGLQWAAAGAWHLWFFPMLVIVATVLSLHALALRGRRRRAALRF